MADNVTKIAEALPDIPRWVETRSLLLRGHCSVVGEKDDWFLLHDRSPLAAMIGTPPSRSIRDATDDAHPRLEIICPPENVEWLSDALPDWRAIPAIIHAIPEGSTAIDKVDISEVRLLEKRERGFFSAAPPHWIKPLEYGLETSFVAAASFEAEPASFCASTAVTESLWDVSIITLEGYRQLGLGSASGAFLIRHMRELGKEPVWRAIENNSGSLRLAEKLGFEPVDRTYMFVGPEFPEEF
ncbi:MAG: GNAT family N-acetyltransferase [Planctomycetota bacterium]|nr:GNAT family N-acetyltransferase [Planctomycetota bacterium]